MDPVFNLPMSVFVANPKPVDVKFGPYTGIGTSEGETFHTDSPIYDEDTRYLGLTIGIIVNSKIVLYWFNAGVTDVDLVIKDSGSTGLMQITEGGNTGLIKVGDNRENKGDIGDGAVDLSYSDFIGSDVKGATGQLAHAEGYGTEANTYATHAEGTNTEAGGYAAHSEGYLTKATNEAAHAEGKSTIADGNQSHAEGNSTVASSDYSHTEGLGTKANNEAQHSAGKYNVGTSPTTIHETGIGANDGDRKNAFEIHTDGKLLAPGLTIDKIIDDKSLVTKEYSDISTTTGLEQVTEGGNVGLVKVGDNRTTKGNIGQGAIDLSHCDTASETYGATGDNSNANGYNNSVSSNYGSNVNGYANTVQGSTANANGNSNFVNGDDGSNVNGGGNIVTGDDGANSNGFQNNTTGDQGANANGYQTVAEGNSSTSLGVGTKAQNIGQISAGKYNNGVSSTTICEIGIGVDDANRDNALEVHTTGEVTVNDFMRLKPSSTPLSPSSGMVYMDEFSYKLRCYDGTDWNDLW